MLSAICAPIHVHAHLSAQLHFPIFKCWHLPRFFLSVLRYAKVATHLHYLLGKQSPKHCLAQYLLLTLATGIAAKVVDLLALGDERNKASKALQHSGMVLK